MSSFINEILKGIDDNSTIAEEIQDVEAISQLLNEYNEYRAKFDATIPYISEESLGKELKEALTHVPPKIRLGMLSRYTKLLDSSFQYFTPNYNPTEVEDIEQKEIPDKSIEESKHYLMKWVVWSFLGLSFVSIFAIIYNSIYTDSEGHVSLVGILSNFVEILKVLIGV